MVRLTYRIFLACGLLCYFAACTGYSITGGPGRAVPEAAQVQSETPRALLAVHSVYVAPVTLANNLRDDAALVEILTGLVEKHAKNHLNFETLQPKKTPIMFQGTNQEARAVHARATAKKIGADTILITSVQQYTERVGTAAAAEQGARVAFTFNLQRVTTGESIWKASYVFKDQALTDNILRLGERVREVKQDGRSGWWTARELFSRGAEQLMVKLNNDRLSQFTSQG